MKGAVSGGRLKELRSRAAKRTAETRRENKTSHHGKPQRCWRETAGRRDERVGGKWVLKKQQQKGSPLAEILQNVLFLHCSFFFFIRPTKCNIMNYLSPFQIPGFKTYVNREETWHLRSWGELFWNSDIGGGNANTYVTTIYQTGANFEGESNATCYSLTWLHYITPAKHVIAEMTRVINLQKLIARAHICMFTSQCSGPLASGPREAVTEKIRHSFSISLIHF